MPDEQAEEMLTIADVAKAFSLSKMTVYRMCHRGELAYRQIGRKMLVPRSAVDQLVQEAWRAPASRKH